MTIFRPAALPGVCALALLLWSAGAQSETVPLWEAGVGLAGFQAPEYRGDTRINRHLLPFPLFIYNGRYLRFGRDGLSGLLFKSDVFKLDVSGNASTPVNSDRTALRKGMPDLDTSFEFGPALDVVLMKNKAKKRELGLTLNVRSAVSTDFNSTQHLRAQGWTSNPHIYYHNDTVGGQHLRFSISGGPVFADRSYHRFYYQVRPEFAQDNRPRYDAGGGYGGIRTTVAMSKHFGALWVSLFARYDYLGNAVYDDSPLLADKSFLIAGVVFNYILKKSSTMVDD